MNIGDGSSALLKAEAIVSAELANLALSAVTEIAELGEAVIAVDQREAVGLGLEDDRLIELTMEGEIRLSIPLSDQTVLDLAIAGTQGLPLGLLDPAPPSPSGALLEGVLEPWSVDDDATSVNGLAPWTRIAGTALRVVSQRAVVIPGEGGLQIARMDISLGSLDQIVEMDLALFRRLDAAAVTGAVLARMQNDASLTFYQGRALLWNGGNWFDIWRVIDDVWVRIGAIYSAEPVPGQRLRLRVSGTPTPTLMLSVDGTVVLGPIDDPGGISDAGNTFGGLMGAIDGGTQAQVAFDNWLGAALGSPEYDIHPRTTVPIGLRESVKWIKDMVQADSLRLRLTELPFDTFAGRAGADALAVLVNEGARLALGGYGADESPLGLAEEAAVVILGQSLGGAEAPALAVVETYMVTKMRGEADAITVGLGEAVAAPVDLSFGLAAEETVGLTLGEAAPAPAVIGLEQAIADVMPIGLGERADAPEQTQTAPVESLVVGVVEGGVASDTTVLVPVLLLAEEQAVIAGAVGDTVTVSGLDQEAHDQTGVADEATIIIGEA